MLCRTDTWVVSAEYIRMAPVPGGIVKLDSFLCVKTAFFEVRCPLCRRPRRVMGLQLEARYLVPWQNNIQATPSWIAPADQGGVLVSAGLVFRFDLLGDRGGDS